MLKEINGITIGISDIHAGDMSFIHGCEREEVELNREYFLRQGAPDPSRAVFMRPHHGIKIEIVSREFNSFTGKDFGTQLSEYGRHEEVDCDILISKDYNLPLVINSADCPVISFWNKEYFGIAHAGRNGTNDKVLVKAINWLIQNSNKKAGPIKLYFGNSIGPCCYKFNIAYLEEHSPNLLKHKGARVNGRVSVDLLAINKEQIIEIPDAGPIYIVDGSQRRECTCCTKELTGEHKHFSHLRSINDPDEHPEGRSMTYIVRTL